jgi:4-amino-4-deoxy-L-arabinose transferase-like glycosyltransferase
MNVPQQTATPPALPASAPVGATPAARPGGRVRSLAARAQPHHLALAGVLALSAVLNTNKLAQNGYANIFYSAAVKSMLHSLHNFVFVAFDPGGLVTVDKPPLALWVQALSAKLFGFSPLSQLLPEAIAGVLAVAVLYRVMALRLGAAAGLAGALALAVFPSFVAVSRDTGVDPALILLMVLACGSGLRAAETGRLRTLVWCGVLIGLAFNAKTLAAYLVVPGIALAYLVCAPASMPRRAGQLLIAGAVMIAVSFSWSAFVDLTPASQRPYVGSSTNNSELGLTFEYNGLGRVGGQVGGPGRVQVLPGARVPASQVVRASGARPTVARGHGAASAGTGARPKAAAATPGEAKVQPIPFGGPAGPLRLFGVGLGDQGAWILPFSLIGLLGLALLIVADRAPRAPTRGRGSQERPEVGAHAAGEPGPLLRRGDPRLATALVLGGWFLVEAIVLSLSKGIVHPYYVSALAPGAAAMAGAGAVALVKLAPGPRQVWGLALAPCAVGATVLVQIILLHRERYMLWFVPLLLVGAAAGVGLMLAARRLAAPAMAFVFCLLLVAPAAYSTTTWRAPVEGTFPAAGPRQASGAGGFGVNSNDLKIYRALMAYVQSHHPGSRWALLTVAANTSAPFILMGLDAGALGGYSGTDPVLDGHGLARLVAKGQARFVMLGGEFSTRGGNRATRAVLRACRQLPDEAWNNVGRSSLGFVLFDCAGDERGLSAA